MEVSMRAVICCTLLSASTTALAAESFGSRHDAVHKHFMSDEEPTVKDALWTRSDLFKVGVLDNGSNRNGFAQYVCAILDEHGFRGSRVTVHVIDIAKLVQTGAWEKLGETRCP